MTDSPTAAAPAAGPDATPEAGALLPEAGATPPEGLTTAEVEQDPPRRRRKVILLLILFLALLLLLGLAIWYLLFRQPLPGIPGTVVMPGYTTAIYGVNRPLGAAVSADGNRIYIGETEGDRIARVFDGAGTQLGLMQPPLSTGGDHVPVYLAVDPQTGEVYVTDRPTGSIYIYDANGTYQREFTAPEAVKGWQPLAIAFDTAGNLYVTDVGRSPQGVVEIDRQGNVLRTLGEGANLSFPNGVAVDKNGYVYVTDSNNGRLVIFDAAGNNVAQVGRGVGEGNLGLPRGIVISTNDRVYVADATGQQVFVYSTYKEGDRRLEFLGSFGSEGLSDGQFEFPNGLALDGRGRVYVVDSANDRVQVWSY